MERATLLRLAQALAAHGLTFLQTKTDDGAYTYTLDPYVASVCASPRTCAFSKKRGGGGGATRNRPVDTVVRLEGTGSRPLLPFPYAVRQLIANEVRTCQGAGSARCTPLSQRAP
jgi:hypothetical protein